MGKFITVALSNNGGNAAIDIDRIDYVEGGQSCNIFVGTESYPVDRSCDELFQMLEDAGWRPVIMRSMSIRIVSASSVCSIVETPHQVSLTTVAGIRAWMDRGTDGSPGNSLETLLARIEQTT